MSSTVLPRIVLLTIATATSVAAATPALPGNAIAEQAVQNALSEPTLVAAKPEPKAAPTPAAAAKPSAPAKVATKPATPAAKAPSAAQERQQGIKQAQQSAARTAGRVGVSAIVRSTAYNSIPNQTDATPFITATGTRTRFGVIALSRDLLRKFPYGTKVRIEDLSGRFNSLLANQIFVVEDTMHPRKSNTVDVWMSTRGQALQWGVRNIRITAVN
ncbi:3D domain-containing protein [Deinococcus pimensis]|uniref:3D domain-containing protein n=1 Tax=Deinococcus pimensis TaxID=309888 RepID=UPI0004814738|nr:3D domain-containing protein [Deinococcus pimensis]